MDRLLEYGFLKLPDIGNISKRPDDPYTGTTSGVIHAQKFINLFEFLIEGKDWNDLIRSFEGHFFQLQLRDMDKATLADFCRHLILANKDIIVWELVDELLDKLDKNKFIPKWELPSAELYNKLVHETHTSIINLKIEETITRIFNQIVTGFEDLDISSIDLKNRTSMKFQVWNYKDLLELYEVLHEPRVISYFEKQDVQISLLTNKITRLFISTIENSRNTMYQHIGLAFLFLKEYVKEGHETYNKAQELVDLILREIEGLSHQEKISFRYLLGATYSFIIYQISTSQSDFITRRKLLGKLISNNVTSKDFSISRWFGTLVHNDVLPEVIIYILEGYIAFSSSLIIHIMELPEGKVRNELIELAHLIITDLHTTYHGYLRNTYMLPELSVENFDEYYQGMKNIGFGKIIETNFESLIINITSLQIRLLGYSKESITFDENIQLVREIFRSQNRTVELSIFDLGYSLISRSYAFDELYVKIYDEFQEGETIILSETFENEIINPISYILDFLLKAKGLEHDYIARTHELLIVFLGEWLNVFSRETELYNDAFMLLTPIVSINFIQLIREHFIKNRIHKAFLTFLNMYYFTEFCVHEIKEANIWKVSENTLSQNSVISSKFNSIIKEWKIEDFLNFDSFKKSVTKIEISIVESGADSSDIMNGMLEDEIILGFMSNIQRLEEFIEKSSDTINQSDSNTSIIDDINILYDPPKYDPLNPLSLIGLTNMNKGERDLPFPLIRQIHQYTVSMEFFPINTSFSDIIGNKNLFDSIIEIMSYM